MKHFCLFITLAFMLTGCSVREPVWECVSDTVPAVPVASWQEQGRDVLVEIPGELKQTDQTESCTLYETDDGAFQLEQLKFLSADLDQAVFQLSGLPREKLTLMQTGSSREPQYQFTWCSQGAEETWLCRANLIMEGLRCYAVVCRLAESNCQAYAEDVRQVCSSFQLKPDEFV